MVALCSDALRNAIRFNVSRDNDLFRIRLLQSFQVLK